MRLMLRAMVILAATGALSAADPYHLIKEIPVGGAGGWDYVSVDSSAHRLYISHSTRVMVVDLDTGKVVGEIAGTDGVHGFAIAPELGRGFSSNGRASTSTIVDLKTLKPIGTVKTGERPDAIMYEPDRQEVYAFNGTGKSATVFEARTGKIVATIPLGGKPEAAVADKATSRVFVNIEDTGAIAVIDTRTHTLAATWPLAGCEEPTGLGYDAARHRLFSACHSKIMVVTDSTSGKRVTSVPIGERTDGAAFDPATGYAFSSNEGTLTIAHLDTADKLTVVQTLPTPAGSRTMILDPTTHKVYLPAATMGQGADGKPALLADTFRVLVYGMS
jgi:DNA-binding beta-propeller fold protein YncE